MEKRKSYTLSKEREVWTPEEHAKFLECLARYGRDWKRAEAVICTKNVLQIRSHAQKHFMKLRRPEAAASAPADGWAARGAPADAAAAAGKALLHPARRAGRYSYADAAAAAAAAAVTVSEGNSNSSSGGGTGPQSGGDGSSGGGAAAAEMRSLGPALLTAARFEEWLGENNLLPPNEGFAQFAEAQQRLHEQLRTAQEFLQHVMGYSSGGVGSVSSSSSSNAAAATGTPSSSSSSSSSPLSCGAVDYLRVYTFLCVAVEAGAGGAALQERLQQLRPLEQEVAVLLLHQLVVTRVARRLRSQFDAHAARVQADLRRASSPSSAPADAAAPAPPTVAAPAQPFSSYQTVQGDGM